MKSVNVGTTFSKNFLGLREKTRMNKRFYFLKQCGTVEDGFKGSKTEPRKAGDKSATPLRPSLKATSTL